MKEERLAAVAAAAAVAGQGGAGEAAEGSMRGGMGLQSQWGSQGDLAGLQSQQQLLQYRISEEEASQDEVQGQQLSSSLGQDTPIPSGYTQTHMAVAERDRPRYGRVYSDLTPPVSMCVVKSTLPAKLGAICFLRRLKNVLNFRGAS